MRLRAPGGGSGSARGGWAVKGRHDNRRWMHFVAMSNVCRPSRDLDSVRPGREHVFVSAEASILHADLDSFYASVEQRDEPRLRGRPVIVGAGVVLAASYEAKAYGIRTAMGGTQARRLCPQAVVVPPR